jgi:starch phosphorylase
MKPIKESYSHYLRYILAKDNDTATAYDKFMALSYVVRSEMVDRWIETQRRYHAENVRRVYFLSTEYMLGRSLRQNIINLDIEQSLAEHATDMDISTDDLFEQEEPIDLGNGGKARLAACMQDSIATQNIPCTAYGLRYDYGVFHQEIEENSQVENPYDLMNKGHPWEIVRHEYCCEINFYGKTERKDKPENPQARIWTNAEKVIAVPYDVPITGYHNSTVNTLRLWVSRASEKFLPDYANHGDYVRACEEKSRSGMITNVLFPEEDVLRATELRLKQHYFLISASLHDIIRRFKQHNSDLLQLPEKIVIQLSGSSCALAIPELMRLLVDIENMPWKTAWEITRKVFAYTSHAVSKESLETWPVYMITQLLPRHMEIIYEINQYHLDDVRARFGNRDDLIREVSVIQEGDVKRVRLANLAVLGSCNVNGVSASQTQQLASLVFPEFNLINSGKFSNKTNGVSHRRWMLSANRPLSELISSAIGDEWLKKPENLKLLEPFAHNDDFLSQFTEIRISAKKELSAFVKKNYGIDIDPGAMFDVHCKKIHQYKRQVLHVFNILSRYVRIKNGESVPGNRVHIFAGKAAPSDQLAKQIIKLINIAVHIVNDDPVMSGKMRVIFLPDYNVSLAEKILPAVDLSEQIATPGQEACGTGNMKLALNGAITIASRGGSNIELIEHIGADNMILFGKSVSELPDYRKYTPSEIISSSKHLADLFSLLEERLTLISGGGPSIKPLLSTLKDSDRYYVLLDFDDYIRKQNFADEFYADNRAWMSKSVLNIAGSGWFSVDRTVAEYAREIWKVPS